MSDDSIYSGDVDPEIAALLNDQAKLKPKKKDINKIFDKKKKENPVDNKQNQASEETTAAREEFPEVTEIQQKPRPFFDAKNYYPGLLKMSGNDGHRLHKILAAFLNAKDAPERSMYRNKIIPAYWDVLRGIVEKLNFHQPLLVPVRMLLRFAVLVPNLLTKEHRDLLSSLFVENRFGEPIYYQDEWLLQIAKGEINPSSSDETKNMGKKKAGKVQVKLDKAKGQKNAYLESIRQKINKMKINERALLTAAQNLQEREMQPGFDDLQGAYNPVQKKSLNELNEIVKELSKADKELESMFPILLKYTGEVNSLKQAAIDQGEIEAVDTESLTEEVTILRQMAKLCVGRQGNHLPILMKNYFHASIIDLGCRENVLKILKNIETLDINVFSRTFKMQEHRIVPNFILLPCYGDRGFCWEPFDRYNRATSRGRIALPMYPKNLKIAVISGLADLRWQIAKEKAQHYWMEEGLTGHYYQWFSDQKKKGDVRDAFIEDYILWITKESEGTQKLDREVRGIFWRHIPFPQDVKDKLKNRGYVYSELYKKDQTRAMSVGY